MAEDSVKRKLRAILSADVKGYSRMMGEDEVGTYQTLTTNLESIRSIISEHDGRVFSSPGDAVMAEFSSSVDVLDCAVAIQEKLAIDNQSFVTVEWNSVSASVLAMSSPNWKGCTAIRPAPLKLIQNLFIGLHFINKIYLIGVLLC